MPSKDIKFLTLRQMISATVKDNVDKFRKYAEIKIDVEEDDHDERVSLTKTVQPEVAFHRIDIDKLYIIHYVLINKAKGILEYLLESMTDWSRVNFFGCQKLDSYTFFHILAFNLYYEKCQIKDGAKETSNDAVACIKLLLSKPELVQMININEKDRLGATALHYLCIMPNILEIIKLFIDSNASLVEKDKEGNSIMHYAIKHNNVSS